MNKPVMNTKTVKLAIKIAAVILAVAAAVVAEVEAGTITDAAGLVMAVANAIAGNLDATP